MQDAKTVGRILFIVGILILLVSLLADVVGLGRNPSAFGWKQILGLLVGLGVAGVGFWLVRKK